MTPRSSLPPGWPPLPSEEEMERSFTQWEREQKVQVTPVDIETAQKYYPQALSPEWEECE